jgi:outer membrane protein
MTTTQKVLPYFMKKIFTRLLLVCALITTLAGTIKAEEPKKIFLGYFEGGHYAVHSGLREEFERQARLLAPPGVEFVFIPQGYRSAGWKRDSCRILARQLVGVERVDVMITMGPWVVEDLLEAGYKKPILSMYRFEPQAEGLIDAVGNPKWPNLTLHGKSNKIESDLTAIAGLFHPKKVGFLFFPSGNERDSVVACVSFLARRLNMDVVSAEGADNFGAFAFFRALANLPKDIDALYIGPLWGLDDQKMSAFFDQIATAGIPALTYDAHPAIQFGALASNAGYTHIAEARFNAEKLIQIINKERPSDLPTGFAPTIGLTINRKTLRLTKAQIPAEALREALQYGSSIPEDATSYTLINAISRTLAHHPDYQSALEGVSTATAQTGMVKASSYPQIKAEGIALWRDDNKINNLERTLRNDGYRGSLIVEQELFSKSSSSLKTITKHKQGLSEHSVKMSRGQLLRTVEDAYLSVLEAEEQFTNAQQNRLVVDRLRELSWPRERFESRPVWERNRLEMERLSASISANEAEASRIEACAVLNALFNLPADAPFLVDTGAFSNGTIFNHFSALSKIVATTEGEKQVTSFLQQSAQENNHELLSSRMNVELARLQHSAVSASRYPTLSLRGSLDFTDELEVTDLLKEKSPSATASAHLELPLFLGGKTGKERQIRTAELNQAEFSRDAVSLEIMKRVAALSADFFSTLSSLPLAMQKNRQANQYLVSITEEFEAGRVTLADFLDASSQAKLANESMTKLQYHYFRTISDLVYTIGWEGNDTTSFDRLFITKIHEHYTKMPKK